MIAVDTPLLVYAHRADSPHHERARAALRDLVMGRRAWAIPWPCLHEFLGVVTHPRIFEPPTSMSLALATVNRLLAQSRVDPLAETADHATVLAGLLTRSDVVGPKVHDARIAAICLAHGVNELWTADRDFSYFPQLRTHNPLVA